jgi:hypothetical protein
MMATMNGRLARPDTGYWLHKWSMPSSGRSDTPDTCPHSRRWRAARRTEGAGRAVAGMHSVLRLEGNR